MTKNKGFTDKERAEWHEDRRSGKRGDTDTEFSSVSSDTCINCGNPLGRNISDGYEAALCDACD